MNQAAHSVLMIRPSHFGSNPETSNSNSFQKKGAPSSISVDGLSDFNNMLDTLHKADVNVLLFDDIPGAKTPDAVFPNNWFSTHENGTVVLYPMMAKSRRKERREDIISKLQESFEIKDVIDLGYREKHDEYLEGTGSIVFDHKLQIAYCCESPRSHSGLLSELCDQLDYDPFNFEAVDLNGKPIYHTNVLMHIGTDMAVVCLESIRNILERNMLKQSLEKTHSIVEISYPQMNQFAGNMLEILNRNGDHLTVVSRTAWDSLDQHQKDTIEQHTSVVVPDIPTIEKYGGGSVRCMLAGIHLPFK